MWFLTTKSKYTFSRWFVRFYLASGVSTAGLTRKKKQYNPIHKLYVVVQPKAFKDNAIQIRIYLLFKALSPEKSINWYFEKESYIYI